MYVVSRKWQLSGSTVFCVIAVIAWALAVGQGRLYPKFANSALNPTVVIVYLFWPAVSLVAAIWAGANLFVQRRLQFAIELFVSFLSLLVFYYLVIQAPQGV
jgi:hypothetical protein